MRPRRLQFSVKTLLVLTTIVGIGCCIVARVVHRQIIALRPIPWKQVSKSNLYELANYDRTVVVWGAKYDLSGATPFAKGAVEKPDVRLAVHDLGCACILLDIPDDQFFEEFLKRYPVLKQQTGRILLLTRGKVIGPIELPPDNSSIAHILHSAFNEQ